MKHITLLLLLMIGPFLMLSCFEETLNIETLEITDCTPSNQQTGVSRDASVIITFNNSVDQKELEALFTLSEEGSPVSGDFTWISSRKFSFKPDNDMINARRYVIEIPRIVKDSNGNKMQLDFISEFYVGQDLVAPYVVSSIPAYTEGGTTGIPIDHNTYHIQVDFSEQMDCQKVESAFSLNPDVSGFFEWSPDNTILYYRLTNDLEYGTQYTLKVAESAEDINGNPLQQTYTIVFITGTDFTPPEVVGIYDEGNPDPDPYWDEETINQNISRKVHIVTRFTEPMAVSSTESSFSITPSVSGAFTWNDYTNPDILTFIPDNDLVPETVYTVRISTSARDANGRNLQESYSVRFMTNAPDSQYISLHRMWGSFDNDTTDPFHVLIPVNYTTIPWPVEIETGTTDTYYFKLQFSNSNGTVYIDPYSIMDSITIESFSSETPTITDITCLPGDYFFTVKIAGIPENVDPDNSDDAVFRITIPGGIDGIRERNNDNYMQEDLVFDFMERYTP